MHAFVHLGKSNKKKIYQSNATGHDQTDPIQSDPKASHDRNEKATEINTNTSGNGKRSNGVTASMRACIGSVHGIDRPSIRDSRPYGMRGKETYARYLPAAGESHRLRVHFPSLSLNILFWMPSSSRLITSFYPQPRNVFAALHTASLSHSVSVPQPRLNLPCL